MFQIDVFVLLYFIAAKLQMLDVLNNLELSNYAHMWKKMVENGINDESQEE